LHMAAGYAVIECDAEKAGLCNRASTDTCHIIVQLVLLLLRPVYWLGSTDDTQA
jgi:hypothetical protein